MHADVPPAFHLPLAQAPVPPASPVLEVSPARRGLHPMVVMGTPDAAFLWTLTTFSPPEDTQLFLAARLVHPDWKKRKPDFSSGGYVLQAAEPFDMDALRSGALKRLKVSLSRKGEPQPEWKDVELQVKSVQWHAPLSAQGATIPRLLYRILGSPEHTFLVHELSGAPDFHHVVQVKFQDRRFTPEELARGLMVDVGERPNVMAARLPLGAAPQGSLLEDKPVRFTVEREVVFREVAAP